MLKSEAGAAGQRPKRHLYVLLHDDVEAAHQRPEGEKMYLLIQTVAFEVDLFCFSFVSCSSAISDMAKVSNNVGVFTGNPSYFVYICVHM